MFLRLSFDLDSQISLERVDDLKEGDGEIVSDNESDSNISLRTVNLSTTPSESEGSLTSRENFTYTQYIADASSNFVTNSQESPHSPPPGSPQTMVDVDLETSSAFDYSDMGRTDNFDSQVMESITILLEYLIIFLFDIFSSHTATDNQLQKYQAMKYLHLEMKPFPARPIPYSLASHLLRPLY